MTAAIAMRIKVINFLYIYTHIYIQVFISIRTEITCDKDNEFSDRTCHSNDKSVRGLREKKENYLTVSVPKRLELVSAQDKVTFTLISANRNDQRLKL